MQRNVLLSRMMVFSMLAIGSVIGGGAVTQASADEHAVQPNPPAPTVWLVDKTGKGMMKQACGEDVKKLCPGVQPGEGHIMQCLEQHAKEVSENCGKLLERRAKKRGKSAKRLSRSNQHATEARRLIGHDGRSIGAL